MADLFEPMSEEEFYREVDKGIEQADNGQLQDAHEAMDEITRCRLFEQRIRAEGKPVDEGV